MNETEQGEEGRVEGADNPDKPQSKAMLDPLHSLLELDFRGCQIGLRNEIWQNVPRQRLRMRFCRFAL